MKTPTRPDLTWHDISNEKYREYVYADGSRYRIDNPSRLAVTQKDAGDSHRIETVGDQPNVYVAPGWIAIEWDGSYEF